MTLVEVLVGLVILGMVLGALFAAPRLAGAIWARVEQLAGRTDDIDTFHGLFRGVISGAYPAFASPAATDRRIVFQGEPHMLTLIAPLPGLVPDGAWALMRFSRREWGGGPAVVLDWRLDLPSSDHRPTPEHSDRLLARVGALRFDYFGPVGPGQPPAWQDRWVDRDRLPSLVRVRVRQDGAGGGDWPDIVVATRVTATSACVYDAANTVCHKVP